MPDRLANVTCAQQLGIVKKVRTIDLDPIFAPYNPSIIENEEGGYHIFFRYDVPKDSWKLHPFYSYIGYAELDSEFAPKKITEKLNTNSLYSEDPRIVKVGKDFFLSWNDKILKSKVYSRTIHTGKWNPKNYKLDYITNLDQHIKPVEKNWVPFERWEKNEPYLGFVYGIQPHKILSVPSPKENQVDHLISKGDSALNDLEWTKLWGSLCGGTTARLVDNEYISFFHSYFKEDEKIWYVMGAYTFQAEAPYKITSITPYPVMFEGIYESPFVNTADASKHTIYPSGIALEKKGKKQLLHVSCGENDCAVKIITIDYEKLRKHMVPVK